jgi:TolB protein
VRFPQALGGLLAIAALVAVPAGAAASPGLIAFSSSNSPLLTDHVFTSVSTTGGVLKMLGPGYGPVWSPDGRQVAFRRGLFGSVQLFVMNADGTGVRQVTHASGGTDETISEDARIGWSPDGSKLSYMLLGPVTNVLDLATGATASFPTTRVDWAPDGRRVAYLVGAQGQDATKLVVASPDGSAQQTLASGPLDEYAWSPDSTRIAFTVAAGGDRQSLSVISVADDVTSTVTSGPRGLVCLSWYPDSSRIIVLEGPAGALFAVRADGGGVTRLATLGSNWTCPAISPDGTSVAVVVPRQHDATRGTLQLVSPKGTRILADARLDTTNYPSPIWAPNGRKIALPIRFGRILVVPVSGGAPTTFGFGSSRFYFTAYGEGLPAWRPGGGTFLASAHVAVGYQKIWVAAPDGTVAHALTSGPYDDEYPSWSQDGTTVAFVRGGPPGSAGIWTLDYTGRGSHRLLAGRGYSSPSWSPDGRIAYVYAGGIWVMGGDGSHPHLILTVGGVLPGEISWSPDGSSIAYAAASPDQSIYVVGADGRNVRQLTSGGRDWNPAWSPDGKTIVFAAYRNPDPKVFRDDSAYGLYTVHPDGTGLTKIITQMASHPAWSADGTRIVFQSLGGIYVANADGTNVTKVFSGLGLSEQPAWS